MTTYQWPQLRAHAIEQYGGQTPGGQLEQDILDVFEQHPQTVANAIDRIATRFHAGSVQSPWAVLRADLQRTTTSPDIHATDSTDRDKRVMRAEQWIRATGIHYDRASEVEHHLFGDARIEPTIDPRTGELITSSTPGPLAAWADDTQLRTRLIDLWRTERPRGEQAEADHDARAKRYVQQRDQQTAAAKAARDHLDHHQHDTRPTRPAPSPPEHDDRSPEPEPEPDVFATQHGSR